MGGFSTAVMPPTNRGFDITPPDPYANLKALALQGEAQQRQQEIAASKQTVAASQQQMELTAQKIRDQQAIAQALRNRVEGESPEDFIKRTVDNGASGGAALDLTQHFADLRLKNSQADEAALKTTQTRHDMFRGQAQAVIKSSPEGKQALYEQYLPQMRKELDPGESLPDMYPGDEWMQGQASGHALLSQLSKEGLEQKQAGEAEAKAGQATAEAGKATAEAKKAGVETELLQHKKELYDTLLASPQALQAKVARSINPQKYPDLYGRALNAAQGSADLEGINKSIDEYAKQASEQERTIATETNPQVIGARTTQAINTEVAKSQLAPGAVAQIRDPVLQNRALTWQQDAEKEYRGKEGDAQRVQSFVDAARSGNQAAASLIPITELREIVSRVTNQELGAIGNGLSVKRKIENVLAKNVQGNYSQETLNDFESLGKLMLQAAKRTYSGRMQGLNTNLGAKFPTEPTAAPAQAPAPAANGLPTVGGTFNGHKVLKIEKIQ